MIACTERSRGVLQTPGKWLTALVEFCVAHGGRLQNAPTRETAIIAKQIEIKTNVIVFSLPAQSVIFPFAIFTLLLFGKF